MKTQLFIQRVLSEPNELKNPTFQFGLENWIVDGVETDIKVKDNVCYLLDNSLEQEDIFVKPGWYRITFTITPPRLDMPFNGGAFIIAGGAPGVVIGTSPGEYSELRLITDTTYKKLRVTGFDAFTGGITQIRVEGIGIEWEEIELSRNIDIPITYNIADIQDITTRDSNYSMTIEIPGTKNNNKLFQQLYNINETGSFQLNKPINCYILRGSHKTFEGSFELLACNLLNTSDIAYEGVVYSSMSDLFVRMGDRLLTGNFNVADNIDFSEYNHILSLQNVRNSWTDPSLGGVYNGENGIFYGPVNKWNKEDSQYYNTFRTHQMSPCLYIKEIWDKVFRKYGVKYQSDFLNTDYFKSLMYVPGKIMKYTEDEILSNTINLSGSGSFYQLQAPYNETDGPFIASKDFDLESSGGEWTIDYLGDAEALWSEVGPYIEVQQTGRYNIKFKYEHEMYLTTPTAPWYGNWNMSTRGHPSDGPGQQTGVSYQLLLVRKRMGEDTVIASESYNKVLSQSINMNSSPQGSYSDILTEDTFEFEGEVFLQREDKVFLRVLTAMPVRNLQTGRWKFWTPIIQWQYFPANPIRMLITPKLGEEQTPWQLSDLEDNEWSLELEEIKYDGSLIRGNDILDEIPQRDFIISIIKMFNLFVVPQKTGELLIEPRDDFYQLTDKVVDWTDKLIPNGVVSIERISDIPDKTINFKYFSEDEAYSEIYRKKYTYEYGQYLRIKEQNHDTNDLSIELMFGVSPQTQLQRGSHLETPSMYKLRDDGEVDDVRWRPRILFHKQFAYHNTGELFIVRPSFTWSPNFTYSGQYPFLGHLDNLGATSSNDLMFDLSESYWLDLGIPISITKSNLTNRFWNKMLQQYTDPDARKVTMLMNLNESDIEGFEFNHLVFIKDAYYYVNKISGFLPDTPTEVELLKFNDITINIDDWRPPRPVKPVRPPLPVKPIPYIYIDVIDGNANRPNRILKYNILEGSVELENEINVEVIDSSLPEAEHDIMIIKK